MAPRKNRSLPQRALRAAVALALVFLIAVAVIITLRDRIAALVLDAAEVRLAERGLYIHRTSHELSWQRGVILKDLALYVDEGMQQELARFDNLGVWVPLHELFDKSPTLLFSSEHSDLKLKTSAGNLLLSELDLHLTSQQNSISIDRSESFLNGLHIKASGLVRLPQRDKAAKQKFVMPDLAPLVKASSWLDFPEGLPTLVLHVQPNDSAQGAVQMNGLLVGKDFRWKNLSFGKAKVQFEMDQDTVSIPSVNIDCYGGNLRGGLEIDYRKDELLVTEIVSTVEPFRFVSAILKSDSMASCRSIGKTVMKGENITFNYKEFAKSHGSFRVNSPKGIGITTGSREFVLGDFQSVLKFADGNMVVDCSEFSSHGGKGSGSYTMPLSSPYRYQLRVVVNGVSLDELGHELELKSDLVGSMGVRYEGGGATGKVSHYGKGRVKVRNGKFYAIPLFGALRAMLTEKSPKFGMDEARDLNASFSLKSGILHSPDFKIESAATRVSAEGQIDIIHKTLDVDVRAELKGVIGIVTGIVSRIFEIHGEGPLDAVRWHFGNAPAELVGDAAQVTGEGVKAVTEGTEKVIEGVGGAATKLLKERPGIIFRKKKDPAPKK